MQTPGTNGGESNDYGLLQLLEEVQTDGEVVQHFVCQDCLDLVERTAGSIEDHQCTGREFFLTALRGTVSSLSLK
jgi:hypothetical protein